MKKIITAIALTAIASTSTVMAQSFTEAFDAARSVNGVGATFNFDGKEYKALYPEEKLLEDTKVKELTLNLIDKAEVMYKKAQSKGIAWKDTGKMIKNAKAMYERKEYSEAAKMASEAHFQGRTAIEQNAVNKAKWLANVPPFK